MLGVNFKTAPVEVREELAVTASGIPGALDRLQALQLGETVLLSTCNRTEVYATVADVDASVQALADYVASLGNLPGAAQLWPHLYTHTGASAVRHLFKVAGGLDSMVIGETQILGQVRDAYNDARKSGTTGKTLNQVFEQAVAVGKRIQTETRIGQSAVSVSYAAVELAKKVFQTLRGRRCMAIGAGETAKLTVRHLQAAGVTDIIIANRTLARARNLAEQFQGQAITIEQIPEYLGTTDVVISSTGAPGYVLTKAQITEAARHRRGRPIFLFDIAVPRDIDPAVAELTGAFLYNIDDLHNVVAANLHERTEEARRSERIIDEELQRFQRWLLSLEVVPTIKMLRDKVESIRQEELSRTLSRLPDLTDRERAVIEAMTVTMVNKILNEPTQQLKGMAGEGRAEQAVDTVARLFDLRKPEPAGEKEGG